jgi:phage shock protein B
MFNAMLSNPATAVYMIPIVAIICGTIMAIVEKGKKKELSPEDTQIMQELHQGISRLEKRIEALETILFDEHKGAQS